MLENPDAVPNPVSIMGRIWAREENRTNPADPTSGVFDDETITTLSEQLEDEQEQEPDNPDPGPCLRERWEYLEFMVRFVKCVLSEREYKDSCARQPLDDYVPPGLEAFLVVTYHNQYYEWLDQLKGTDANRRGASDTESTPSAASTTPSTPPASVGGESAPPGSAGSDLTDGDPKPKRQKTTKGLQAFTKKPGVSKYNGWSEEGLNEFVVLRNIIQNQRKQAEKEVPADLEGKELERWTNMSEFTEKLRQRLAGVEEEQAATRRSRKNQPAYMLMSGRDDLDLLE